MEKNKVIAVVGPTASGKTALSVELARRIGGEVISCDSMQIYKEMDIGTAKPTVEEMRGIPHHLIDFVEPSDNFSCADYSALAKEKISEILSYGKVPVFCGGTGLYVDHALSDTSFSEAGRDDEYRKYLEEVILSKGIEPVFVQLKSIDPESASVIHPNNTKRVIRALEIYHVTGKTKTEWDRNSKTKETPYDSRFIFLDYRDRSLLYERIDKRVDVMMNNGLLDEVKKLLDKYGDQISTTAKQAIGYKELFDYFDCKCTLEDAIENIKKGSRNYAKRQITWFKRNKDANVIYVDDYSNFDEIVNIAEKTIKC